MTLFWASFFFGTDLWDKEKKIIEKIIKEVAKEGGVTEEVIEKELEAYFRIPYKRPAERVLEILRRADLAIFADFWRDEKIQRKKILIAHHFLSDFLLYLLLTNSLDVWTKQSYHLPFNEIAVKLLNSSVEKKKRMYGSIESLYLETLAYGMTELSITPIMSLVSLVDIENAKLFVNYELVSGITKVLSKGGFPEYASKDRYQRYSEVRTKYIKMESGKRFDLFRESTGSILNSLDKEIKELFSIEPEAASGDEMMMSNLIFSLISIIAQKSMEDIFHWTLSLKDSDVYKIANEIGDAAKKSDKERLALLRFYGFGTEYLDKIKKEMLLPLLQKYL